MHSYIKNKLDKYICMQCIDTYIHRYTLYTLYIIHVSQLLAYININTAEIVTSTGWTDLILKEVTYR